jgi:DNA-binding CsgD family transcriptional regulator
MTPSRAPRVTRGQPPRDLRVRLFRGDDGRDYAALWFSRQRDGAAKLTEAEREVAAMIRAGFSNAAIAGARRVAKSTVATQVRSVFAKLGVVSRGDLVARSAARFER